VKVLILHQHYRSPKDGGAIRSYYLAKALVDRGVEVTVITGGNQPGYRREHEEGVEVHYLAVAYDNTFEFAARSTAFLKYAYQSFRLAKTIPDVDYCYAISVPLTVGLTALALRASKKWPYLFEVGDLWPDAPVQMGVLKNRLFIWLMYRLEKYIYKHADAIVALSDPIRDAIRQKCKHAQVHVVTNFADCDFYKPEYKRIQFEEKWNVKGRFVISYIGAAGVANGLDYFLECANSCRKAGLPVHFMLCGDGATRAALQTSATRLGLTNITFTGFITRDEVSEVLNVTDAVLVCYRNVPVLQTGSPNKYFDGLAAGKMILTNFGGWITSEIEAAGCGLGLDPRHPTDILKKIAPFLHDQKRLHEFQRAARQLAETKYDRRQISRDFADIFLKRNRS